MTLDVAVVGAPFLDLTFEGLPRLPRAGEEVVARALHVAPGGTGMQALGAARLGLSAALVAPIGSGGAAGLLRESLEREGVRIVGRDGRGVPTTALLSTAGGVAMATALEGAEPVVEDVASLEARTALLSLRRLRLAPPGAARYAVTGGLEVDHVDQATLERLAPAEALVLNAAEAARLTGRRHPGDAARDLARHVKTAVVTLGADGAIAAEGELIARARAPRMEVVDATGAGDLFAAAYVWADLCGASLAERLAWASLYAGLSVRAPTAFAGAIRLQALLAAGRSRGLIPPPGAA
jgi:ribokinase